MPKRNLVVQWVSRATSLPYTGSFNGQRRSLITGHRTRPTAIPVGPGHLALGAALHGNSGDDQARLRHLPTVTAQVFLCLDRPIPMS
jgi:hypothetical protein